MDGKAWLRLIPLAVLQGCNGVIGSSDDRDPFGGPGGGDVGAVGAEVMHRQLIKLIVASEPFRTRRGTLEGSP